MLEGHETEGKPDEGLGPVECLVEGEDQQRGKLEQVLEPAEPVSCVFVYGVEVDYWGQV